MVEKLGRRNLLLLGAVGMCVCQCKQAKPIPVDLWLTKLL